VNVAIGYRSESTLVTEGWWYIEPQACVAIVEGRLRSQFYYIYAVDDVRGGAWTGNVPMCTQDLAFTIRGVEDCVARGYDQHGFVEIDTANQPDWLVYLTEETRQGAGGR
jgi:uncharacterized membrane protein